MESTTFQGRRRLFGSLPACLGLSLLIHLACFQFVVLLNPFNLQGPVGHPCSANLVVVEIPNATPVDTPTRQEVRSVPKVFISKQPSAESSRPQTVECSDSKKEPSTASPVSGPNEDLPEANLTPAETEPADEKPAGHPQERMDEPLTGPLAKPPLSTHAAPPELDRGIWQIGEFITSAKEKLVYRITLMGIPAGTAVLEAVDAGNELRITARIRSNEVVSGFYPVDDYIDTRLIKGNFIVTRIRQREGSLEGDSGFTLMLKERNAFWIDRLRERYLNIPLPREDVTDLVTGFYFLRNRKLEVGKPVLLHLFDGSSYSQVPVDVVRREHLNLPGSRQVDALLVQPHLAASGFFSRTGPLSVWLTDDEKKVPVRLETTISLGRVRADLVSAESGTDTPELSEPPKEQP